MTAVSTLPTVSTSFIEEFEAKYGDHVHVLDWALHLDESTPHIHERHVFDCENKYGEVAPQQEKALEALGFELPDPDKPLSRRNNRKISFDAACRKMLFDIANRQDFLPRDRTGNRRFIPVPVDAELAEVHILDNEEDSRAYIDQLWAEAMTIYNVRKNPFKFKLSDVVPKDAYVRNALTREQQENYLQFVQDYGGNYYDDIVILMGTGLRVSELYGLTRADIDFERHCIHVRRQLCRTAEKPYFVTPPKTKSGIRNVPMTDTVCAALRRAVKARASTKVEALVDGCSGFLFLDKSGMPKVAMHLENYMRGVQGKFEKAYGKPVPRITPHVLRHTFCTNVQQAGLDVKSLQYLIGHSNASVTLDVYTHSFFLCIPRTSAAHPNHRERGRGDVRQTGIDGVCRLAAGVCGGAVPVVSAGAAPRLCCTGGSAEHGHPAVVRPAGQLLRCAGAAAHRS